MGKLTCIALALCMAMALADEKHEADNKAPHEDPAPQSIEVVKVLGWEGRNCDRFCLIARENIKAFLRHNETHAFLFQLVRSTKDHKHFIYRDLRLGLIEPNEAEQLYRNLNAKFRAEVASRNLTNALINFCANAGSFKLELSKLYQDYRKKRGGKSASRLAQLDCEVVDRLNRVINGCQFFPFLFMCQDALGSKSKLIT